MKRSKVLIPLSHDHHHGLRLAQLIRKGAPVYQDLPNDVEGKIKYVFDAWDKELSIHFENEEKILFPAVKGRNNVIDKLINNLLKEHKEIKALVSSLNKNDTNKVEILDELGQALFNHIRKEERDLFEEIQNEFSDEELEKIVGKIEAVN